MKADNIEHGQILGVEPITDWPETYNQGDPNQFYSFGINDEQFQLHFDENLKVSENTSAPVVNRDMDPPLLNMGFAKENADIFYLVEDVTDTTIE